MGTYTTTIALEAWADFMLDETISLSCIIYFASIDMFSFLCPIFLILVLWPSFWQYIHHLQNKYSLSAFNLLGHTAPAQAASLLLLGPFVDLWLTNNRFDTYRYNNVVMVSAVLYFAWLTTCLNFSCTSIGIQSMDGRMVNTKLKTLCYW